MANARLTAAMVGLLRSFAVIVFTADRAVRPPAVHMVNQDEPPRREVVDALREAAAGHDGQPARASLIGSGVG